MSAALDPATDAVAIHRRIAEIASSVAEGADWEKVHIFFWEAGRTSSARVELFEQGAWRHQKVRSSMLMDAFHELRAAMAEPDVGAWLSFDWEIDRSGRLQGKANWDVRPWSNPGRPFEEPVGSNAAPSDEMWAEDLRRYPRSPEYMPAWLRQIAERPGIE